MKKLLTLLLIAATFASCKKEDYSAGEYYNVVYQTTNNTINIKFTSTQDINPANFTKWGATHIMPVKRVTYMIELQGEKSYKVDFIKLDGSIVPLDLRITDQELNIRF